MRIIVIAAFCVLSISPAFCQEDNWGAATSIDNFEWQDSCGNLYGYGSPAIIPNDSLLLLMHYCIGGFRLGYSRYSDNQWQNPLDLGIDGYDPFVYVAQDTVVFFQNHVDSGYGGLDICMARFHDGYLDNIQTLDPPINTADDESSPSLTADGSRLYFLRGANIMYSNIVDGHYSEPVALPVNINSPNLTEMSPKIYPDGSKLYFNRSYGIMAPCIMFVSHLENDIWQEPQRLNDNINLGNIPYPGDYYDYSCEPSFTPDCRKMYFSHIGFPGGEMGSGIMISELTDGINSSPNRLPTDFTLNVYPNPFNSQVLISIDGDISKLKEIAVFNIVGQKIRQLSLSSKLIWNGCDSDDQQVACGIYFLNVRSARYSISQRLTLLK